ncbi:MAG: DNA alkylation repair protein [Candidatus Komeilibacteria bacterium]|jgi:3-methyladenine DNA glycosylase AlkD|nr:DNA alkylation repair protein [Candidatus Komeilibacteria bacterium]MBT4447486.1 DNA alkylation repair protein [Candidatus Komeilibacteria bacterium]
MKATDLIKELKKYASPARKKSNEWFFKTGKGQYGEGDQFIGVTVPNIRLVARQFLDLSFIELAKLIKSPIHEIRLMAILILVERSKQSRKAEDKVLQKKILDFYLKHRKYVNNWDLVDLSAHYILGQAILDGLQSKQILYKYAKSKNLWERRIAIISTWIFIREGKLDDCFRLSKLLLKDKEDLMHKAVGWMLRESWKKDSIKVEKFLIANYKNLPRTTLRYAIERMEEKQRKKFLKGNF